MGPSSKNRPCRAGGRALDFGRAEYLDANHHCRGVRGAWIEDAASLLDDALRAPSYGSGRHRALHRRPSGLGDAPVRPAIFADGATGRDSRTTVARGRRDAQEPDREPGGQAVHRSSAHLLEVNSWATQPVNDPGLLSQALERKL